MLVIGGEKAEHMKEGILLPTIISVTVVAAAMGNVISLLDLKRQFLSSVFLNDSLESNLKKVVVVTWQLWNGRWVGCLQALRTGRNCHDLYPSR